MSRRRLTTACWACDAHRLAQAPPMKKSACAALSTTASRRKEGIRIRKISPTMFLPEKGDISPPGWLLRDRQPGREDDGRKDQAEDGHAALLPSQKAARNSVRLAMLNQLFPERKFAPPLRNSEPRPAASQREERERGHSPAAAKAALAALADEISAAESQRTVEGASSWEGKTSSLSASTGEGPAVLVLSGVSPSLLESDFQRLAPQGQHLDGWVSGITKVIQVRDPRTWEPLGRYYVCFERRSAALAYLDVVKRLHYLDKKSRGNDFKRNPESALPTQFPTAASPSAPDASPDINHRVGAFTLLPPSIMLSMLLRSPEQAFESPEFARHNPWPTLKSGGDGRWSALVPFGKPKDAPEPSTEEQISVKHAPDSHKVLLTCDGSRIPLTALRDAVIADGRMRNLPWQLWHLGRGIMPLRTALPPGAEELQSHSHSGGDLAARSVESYSAPEPTYDRFLLAFSEPLEARRFARSWHKRQLLDSSKSRMMTIRATALW